MQVQRTYRNWDTDDCQICIQRYRSKRVVPFVNLSIHNEMEIVYFFRGRYEFHGMGGAVQVGADTIYIVPPNEPHCLRSLSQDGEYIKLAILPSAISMDGEHFFQKGFVEPLRTGRLRIPRMFRPNDPGHGALAEYMQQICRLYMEDPGCISKRFAYTMGLCTELMQYCSIMQMEAYAPHTESSIVKTCVAYLHEHYPEKISIYKLAEQVHITPSYLCNIFKKETGQTVLGYLNNIRVERARLYLGRTDLPIGQVGERCGFRSLSAFERTFKASTGTTPSKFARDFRKI